MCVHAHVCVWGGEKLLDPYNLDSCLKIRANVYSVYAKHSAQHLTMSILLNFHNLLR